MNDEQRKNLTEVVDAGQKVSCGLMGCGCLIPIAIFLLLLAVGVVMSFFGS